MDLMSTMAGSLMEGFLPAGWDLKKIDACVDADPTTLARRQSWWHPRFEPVLCQSLADFETFLGHEIALTIKQSRDAGEKLVLILPVGPMGMYRWVVYFLNEWQVGCDHVFGFNMDEWSDAAGTSLLRATPVHSSGRWKWRFMVRWENAPFPRSSGPLRRTTSCRTMQSGLGSCGQKEPSSR
jgi:glucosamine-6-phosphate deaminase